MILRKLTGLLSPAGQGGRLSILTFHRVLAEPDPLLPAEPDVARFAQILAWLDEWFHILPLDSAVSHLAAGTLPARAAVITFDDGYANNASCALPVLQRMGMPATFFIASGFLDGGRMWNDSVIEAIRRCSDATLDLGELGLGHYPMRTMQQRHIALDAILGQIKYLEPAARNQMVDQISQCAGAALPDDLMLSTTQLRQLHQAGMQIGAHTVNHPILASLSDAEAQREIQGCKSTLENLLQAPIKLFAYPNGKPGRDYLAKHAQMVKTAGFSAAVSTAPGAARSGCDAFQLPRFTPWDRTRLHYGLRLIQNLRAPDAQLA